MNHVAPSTRALTATLVIAAGCVIAMVSFGPRSAMGLFQTPMTGAGGYGRDVFGFALAVQNLLWGVGQPFMGAIADRFGTVRVLAVGLVLYAAGLASMAYLQGPLWLTLTAGVLIGFGLAGSSFNIVLAAFSKLLPAERRSLAFGFGTAAGSFGQFLFLAMVAGLFASGVGWQMTLLIFAGLMLTVLPLALALSTSTNAPSVVTAEPAAARAGIAETVAHAFRHRSYVFLVLGFFTCGFQLAFITVHMPAYLQDSGLTAETGAAVIALIGIFNIIGSLTSGWLGNRVPKRYILAVIYVLRSVVTVGLLLAMPFASVTIAGGLTVGVLAAYLFGAFMGLLWLSTIPPTAGLVTIMFGTGSMAMLYGFAFFSHQVGAFIGVYLGGVLFEATGTYLVVWWLSVGLGLVSALINLPIKERAAPSLRAQPA